MVFIAPDGPPVFGNISVNLTAITVHLEPVNCTQQNSIIESYGVIVNTSVTNNIRNLSVNIGARETTVPVTIDKLSPNTDYILEVRAVNVDGLKSPSRNITMKTSLPEGRSSLIQLLKWNYTVFFL